MQKWKEKIQKLNFKKTVISFVVIAVILLVVGGITMAVNFGPRIREWRTTQEQQEKGQQEKGQQEKGQQEQGLQEKEQQDQGQEKQIQEETSENNYKEKNNESSRGDKKEEGEGWPGERNKEHSVDLENIINLTQTDKLILGITIGVFTILFCIYWVIVVIGILRMAYRYGVDAMLWGILALFFNLLAVGILYFYAISQGRCRFCGKLQKKNTHYCSRCGKAFLKTCENCGSQIDTAEVYCSNCGAKQKAEEENSEK